MRETFEALSKVKTSSGKAIGWTLYDLPPTQITWTPSFLPVLFFLIAPSLGSHQNGCPELKANGSSMTNQGEGKLSSHMNKGTKPHSILPAIPQSQS